MKKVTSLPALFLAFALLAGCGGGGGTHTGTTDPGVLDSSVTAGTPSEVVDTGGAFSDRDYEVGYNESDGVVITFSGDSVSCNHSTVEISGTTVTLTGEGPYILSGTLNDGMVVVDTDKTEKTRIVLDNVSIHSNTSAAIYILQTDKVFLTLAEGSVNTLSNGGSFEAIDGNNIDAVIFSKEDLTLNGSGTLTITSPGGHGIVSKDDLRITSGVYDLTTASHGMTGKDAVCIANASVTIAAGKDGIQADNDEDTSLGYLYIESGACVISAEGDALSASGALQIDGGDLELLAGGGSENGEDHSSDHWGNMGGGMGGPGGGGPGPGGMGRSGSSTTTTTKTESTSMKGVKSGGNMAINGGNFIIDSADDAFHSNASMTISNGVFEIKSGDDAIHAEQTLTVSGGSFNITECYEGLEALNILVCGGTFTIVASDDGLNAAGGVDQSGSGGRDHMFGGGGMPAMGGSITISGGNLSIHSGGDGLDSNGSLLISGGYTYVTNPTPGDVSVLDVETSASITGGTFVGFGISAMMAMTFSENRQGVIAATCGTQAAGSEVTVVDSAGSEILAMTTEYNTCLLIISTPEMVSGESYTITIGSLSGTLEAS